MSNSDARLKEIVSLKRQAAENRYRSVSKQLGDLDAQISRNQERLSSAYGEDDDGLAMDFTAAERFTRKLIADLKSMATHREVLAKQLELARKDLQNIICSEGVLDDM